MENIYWDSSYNLVLLFDFLIIIGLFLSLRFFSGAIHNFNASDELFKKDNVAFSISLCGLTLGLTLMIMGVIYGDPLVDIYESVIGIGLYGILGIILLAVSRIIFDKIALYKISLSDQIRKGNVAAAIIDAGNVIATGIIINTAMIWVEENTLDGLLFVIFAFVLSQILLTITSFLRFKIFSLRFPNNDMQQEFLKDNRALALHFAGRKIGAAFAIGAAASIMVFEASDLVTLAFVWFGLSILFILVLNIIAAIVDYIILFKIDIRQELIVERNIAVGLIQFVIYGTLGLIIGQLIS